MSREEYWNGNDYRVLKEYIEADKFRQERQNSEAWLQGMYFYQGVSTALHNAFAKKGTPPQKYPDKPYDIGTREKTEAEKRREAEKQRMQAYLYFDGLVQAYNAKHGVTVGK